jgi:hypothetical protein
MHGDNKETQAHYKYDQEERHVSLWGYIRDKKWNIVEGFFDKKVIFVFVVTEVFISKISTLHQRNRDSNHLILNIVIAVKAYLM